MRRGPGARVRRTPENWWWRTTPTPAGRCVIVDVDGVLADATHRQHLITGSHRRWDEFFERCGGDTLIEPTKITLDLFASDLVIVLLTARPEWVMPETRSWMERFDVRWDLLIMRDYGDYSAARDFKHYAVAELRSHGFEPLLALDDDPRNVAMFERAGVRCAYVHSGYH